MQPPHVLVVLAGLAACCYAEQPVVKTSAGDVIGVTLPASDGGTIVDQFLGVPFATAKRFEPPVDFTSTYPNGKIEARMWGPACMQVGTPPAKTYGSEDCLKANVWRPGTFADVTLFVSSGFKFVVFV